MVPNPEVSSGRGPFVELSATLTGFNSAELEATGMVEPYLAALLEIVGFEIVDDLLSAHSETAESLLAGDCLGPVCRNIIVLWYLGQWDQLPADWRSSYGASTGDLNKILSAESYKEGLVWPTMGSHPQAAKQPGYGSWSLKPGTGSYGWSDQPELKQ